MEKFSAAYEAMSEAIETLRPAFLARPKAYAVWMRPMREFYQQFCDKLGREPDAKLLGSIDEALQRMQEPPLDEASQLMER